MTRACCSLAVVVVVSLCSSSRAHATYSLLIADTQTGLLGSVGTSCVGSNQVSRISGIAPGFGAIHAQAQSNPSGRDRGVMMLEAGASAEQVIAAITAPTFDLLAATRQYGVVTLDGSSAGYTGGANMAYAEDRQRDFGALVTSYQGNILTSEKVLDQLAASLSSGQGCDLPDTLMRALEAGAQNGEGDSRCTPQGIPADSGFLRVVARDGSEVIAIEVTAQSADGAVVALRRRFDGWRATHPCAVVGEGDGGAPASDAAMPEADAASPSLTEDASASDAARPIADAATLDASPGAVTEGDAMAMRVDASLRDAGARTDGGAHGDVVDDVPARAGGGGCSLAQSERGAWVGWLLAALWLGRRQRVRFGHEASPRGAARGSQHPQSSFGPPPGTVGAMSFLGKLFGVTPKKLPFHLDDNNFEAEVLSERLPVLVDVWGPSCGPCQQLEPIIMDLAARYDGRVKVCELSAQAAPRTTTLLRVQHTPTVLYFLAGQELERIAGFRSSLFHAQSIEEHFGIAP